MVDFILLTMKHAVCMGSVCSVEFWLVVEAATDLLLLLPEVTILLFEVEFSVVCNACCLSWFALVGCFVYDGNNSRSKPTGPSIQFYTRYMHHP